MTTDSHDDAKAAGPTGETGPSKLLGAILGPPPASQPPPQNGRFRYHACAKCANSVGIVNLAVNTMLMITKGFLGVVGHSTALVADAIHSGADVVAAAMLLFGLNIAKRPADEKYPYGYGKVEFIVAVVIYTSLITAGFVIFYDAVSCIIHKQSVTPSAIALFGAVISVVCNELMFRQSICAGNQMRSPSMLANAWEKRSDALSSVAVLVGIAGAKLGWHFLDPAAAILVAFYILKFSVEMLWEAFKGLLDNALPEDVVEGICRSAEEVQGVKGIRTVRTREIGQTVWVDVEVLVDGHSQMGETARIKGAVREAISTGLGRVANIVVYLKPCLR